MSRRGHRFRSSDRPPVDAFAMGSGAFENSHLDPFFAERFPTRHDLEETNRGRRDAARWARKGAPYPNAKYGTDEERVLALLRGAPNRNILKYFKTDQISWRVDADAATIAKLRVEEYCHIMKVTEHLRRGRSIHEALLTCRMGRDSGLMYSPVTRHLNQAKDTAKALSVFGNSPEDELRFVTVIDSVLQGNLDDIMQTARARIGEFRRTLQNLKGRQARKRAWYADLQVMGFAELEPYPMEEFRAALKGRIPRRRKHRVAGLAYASSEEEIERRIRKIQSRRRKAKLLKELGINSADDEAFFVLHYHFLVRAAKPRTFKRHLKRLFPGNYRVLSKKLFQEHTLEQNITDLVAYMLKVSARYGRLLETKRSKRLLPAKTLLRFCRLHRDLRYQDLKVHLNL